MTAGQKLKEWREGKGLSRAEFAKICGVNRSLILKYEDGKVLPSILARDGLEKRTGGHVKAGDWQT